MMYCDMKFTLLLLFGFGVATCLYLVNVTFFNSLVCLPTRHDLLPRNHYLEFRIKVDKTKKKQLLCQYGHVNNNLKEMLSLQAHNKS